MKSIPIISETENENSNENSNDISKLKSIKINTIKTTHKKVVKETKDITNSLKSNKTKEEIKKEEVKPKELIQKEEREKEISDLIQMVVKKNLDGRRFYEEKMKKWSQSILDEMWGYLIEKYPLYGFGILIFITEELEYFTAGQALFNRDLDSKVIEIYKSPNMSAVVVVFFVKKRKRNVETLFIDPEHFFNINRIFSNAFEKREWSDKVQKYLVNVSNDVNTYIFKDDTLGKSFHQAFGFRNDYLRIHANFKFGNLEFLPYITTYSNDNIIAYLFIFFLNN